MMMMTTGKKRAKKKSLCGYSRSRGALPYSRSVRLRLPTRRPLCSAFKVIGDFLENQADDVENIDYALSPIRDLSATARSLDCTIALREVGHKNRILARFPIDILRIHFEIAPGRRRNVFRRNGSKGRGATAVKCGLRVGFQHRMLICRVPEKDVARTIGKRLYEDVVVHGTANWLKRSWKMISFTIKSVSQPSQGSILEAFEELRAAGGKSWDAISDPIAYLKEVAGER